VTITEEVIWESCKLTCIWDDSPNLPPRERTTQASGVCFTDDGQIVLVGDGRGWCLPGGHPEQGETVVEALAREVLEEACAVVEQCAYLGAQRVDDPIEAEPYFQTRWWARVKLLPFAPRHETTERKLVAPDEFVAALNWNMGRIARAILEAALTVEARGAA
jgi:8-oxo-dGTP pyrophosphatase MutT (NUDIX family)